MGFWKNFVKYIKGRLNKVSTIELIAKNFGALLFVWAGVGATILVSLLTTGVADFIAPVALGIGATLEFTGVLIRSIFGKKEEDKV